jgi:hypothetical protein
MYPDGYNAIPHFADWQYVACGGFAGPGSEIMPEPGWIGPPGRAVSLLRSRAKFNENVSWNSMRTDDNLLSWGTSWSRHAFKFSNRGLEFIVGPSPGRYRWIATLPCAAQRTDGW